jgi:hypothetical protein
MLDTRLVPEKTTATEKGSGPVVDISKASYRIFLLRLEITSVVEQEAIEVRIFGGPAESSIGKVALASFPQVFYAGSYPLLLDLSAAPSVQVLQAGWEVSRWGRGPEKPWFEFGLRLTEVPPELLSETTRPISPS